MTTLQHPKPYTSAPVGDKVLLIANLFDRDPEMRRTLVRAIFRTRDETLDSGFLTQVCDTMSFKGIYTQDTDRESAITLLGHYQDSLPRLIYGRQIETNPLIFWASPAIQRLRAEWIGCPGISRAVDEVTHVLRRAVLGFNVAVIAAWLGKMPVWILMTLPWMRGLDSKTIYRDLDHVFTTGWRYAEKIMEEEFQPVVESAVSYAGRRSRLAYVISAPVLPVALIAARRAQVASRTGGLINQPMPKPDPGYRLTRSGIYVPK